MQMQYCFGQQNFSIGLGLHWDLLPFRRDPCYWRPWVAIFIRFKIQRGVEYPPVKSYALDVEEWYRIAQVHLLLHSWARLPRIRFDSLLRISDSFISTSKALIYDCRIATSRFTKSNCYDVFSKAPHLLSKSWLRDEVLSMRALYSLSKLSRRAALSSFSFSLYLMSFFS